MYIHPLSKVHTSDKNQRIAHQLENEHRKTQLVDLETRIVKLIGHSPIIPKYTRKLEFSTAGLYQYGVFECIVNETV